MNFPIIIFMKYLYSIIFFVCAAALFAAPPVNISSMSPAEMRQRVINAAIRYENTPYLYGGMTARGLDCSGFISLSFSDALGVSLPRSASGIYTWAVKINREVAQPGDLLFFRTTNSGNISHVALYLGNGRFIHSASHGERTGVIFSSLSEPYWARTYAAAGRAMPAVPAGERVFDTNNPGSQGISSGSQAESSYNRNVSFSIGIAPTWNILFGNNLFRGFSSHLHLTADTKLFGPDFLFGIEIRPEYDGVLGVFRLPVTLSIGIKNKFYIYAGPVLSFGDPAIGERHYSEGTTLFRAAGLLVMPFNHITPAGVFSPYLDISLQSYINDDEADFFADLRANTRVSTGVRWTIKIR